MIETLETISVDRRSGLTHRQFVNEYRNPGKPVILTDVSKIWKASTKFIPEYFQDNLGNREISISGKSYKLSEFIDILKNSTKENPALYPCKLNIRTDFSDLVPDISPRPSIAQPHRTHSRLIPRRFLDSLEDLEVFIGGLGGEFPYLHYDYMGLYAFINQLYGEKEFTLFPPEQQKYLYPKENFPWQSEIENHHNPDDLGKYPLFANSTPTTITVSAGETLFIPCGWYHTAKSLKLTISVAFNQICKSDWEFFMNEFSIPKHKNSLKAKMIQTYLAGLSVLITVRERMMETM